MEFLSVRRRSIIVDIFSGELKVAAAPDDSRLSPQAALGRQFLGTQGQKWRIKQRQVRERLLTQ